MPFIARRNSPDGTLVSPVQADENDSLYCPECGGVMGIRGGYENDRERHFWHIDNLGNGDGGNCTGVGQETGESEIHRRVKRYAVSKLRDRFDAVATRRIGSEIPIDVTTSSSKYAYRRTDAMAEFEDKNRLFGKGLIIEVQHQHTGKNIARVSADAIAAGYSILWLTAEESGGGSQLGIPDIDACLNTDDLLSFTPYRWTETEILDSFDPEQWFSLTDEWQFEDPHPTCKHEFQPQGQVIMCLLCQTIYEWHEPSDSPIFEETYGYTFEVQIEGERPDFPDVKKPHIHRWFDIDSDPATADPRYRKSIQRERCGKCRAAKVTDSRGNTVVDHTGQDIYEITTALMRQQERCDHTWHQYEDRCIRCEVPKEEADFVHSNDWF